MSQVRLHSSNPNLCVELADFKTPVTRLTDSIDSASDYIKLQEDFCIIAQKGEQSIHAIVTGSTLPWQDKFCVFNLRFFLCVNCLKRLTNSFFEKVKNIFFGELSESELIGTVTVLCTSL